MTPASISLIASWGTQARLILSGIVTVRLCNHNYGNYVVSRTKLPKLCSTRRYVCEYLPKFESSFVDPVWFYGLSSGTTDLFTGPLAGLWQV
jgi:hypothetical protein